MGKSGKITIKDLAEKAGVSKTAVSFAFNSPERISTETYETISVPTVAEINANKPEGYENYKFIGWSSDQKTPIPTLFEGAFDSSQTTLVWYAVWEFDSESNEA